MINEIKFKLPKQWKDWCKSMHLRPAHKHGHNKYNWYYLKGRGYMWRVNCYAML